MIRQTRSHKNHQTFLGSRIRDNNENRSRLQPFVVGDKVCSTSDTRFIGVVTGISGDTISVFWGSATGVLPHPSHELAFSSSNELEDEVEKMGMIRPVGWNSMTNPQ